MTVSDKKIGISSNGSTVNYYTADVVSANDYYPGGMIMPGRKFSTSAYRYGYNGKENDNEVKGEGNQVAFENRVYDPRTVRWYSLDPLQKKYPGETHYGFVSGNPIVYADADGRDKIFRVTTIGKDGRTQVSVSRDKDFFVYTKVDVPGFGNNRYYKNDLVIDLIIDQRSNKATYKENLGDRKETSAFNYYYDEFSEWGSNKNSRGSQAGGITLTSSFSSQADGAKTDVTEGSDGSINIDLINAAFGAVSKEAEALKLEIESAPEIITLANDLKEVYSENSKESPAQKQKPVKVRDTVPGKWDFYIRNKDGNLKEAGRTEAEAPITKPGRSGAPDTIYTKVYSEPSPPTKDIPRKH